MTSNDQPAEAPAIDDDLLIPDGMMLVDEALFEQMRSDLEYARADARHWFDGYRRLSDEGRVEAEYERGRADDFAAELERLRAAWTAEARDHAAESYLWARQFERERDEARAEAEQWRQDCDDARAYVNALTDDVERLRAAQPDHSRFRVWRTPRGIEVQEGNGFMMLWSGTNASKLADPTAIRAGADRERDRAYAVAALLDAEAAGAGATTDDEDLYQTLRAEQGPANYAEDNFEAGWHAALDAHQARSGQDGSAQ